MKRSNDFDLRALYVALDEQRQKRELSWAQAAREINRLPQERSRHAISPSTVTGTRTRTVAEGDGILQMLLWLDRTPESFVPGHPDAEAAHGLPPEISADRILRFDTRKLHAALDAQRTTRKMTWRQVAIECGVGASTLTHLSKGGRTAFPQVMRITRWLERPASHFMRASDR